MPTTKRSRTPAREVPSKEIAVVEKYEFELEFERITKEMVESFDRTKANVIAALANVIETLPPSDLIKAEIATTFDHIEQAANEMIDRLQDEATRVKEKVIDGLTVPGSFTAAEVGLAKQLSALHDETQGVWSKVFEVGEGVARSVATDSDHNGN